MRLPKSEPDTVQEGSNLYEQVWQPESPTFELVQTPLFKPEPHSMSPEERTQVTFGRAKKICEVYNLTVEDVLYLTTAFWKLQTDLIVAREGGAMTVISVQYTLCVGTAAPFAKARPALQAILQRAMKFEVFMPFMLTEVGHGLDARNLETTATLLPDGGFELHSPTPGSAKCMPPSTTLSGLPTFALVMARLIVEGEDRGVRPFVVPLNDGNEMFKGVVSKLMPPRTGAHPIGNSITYFNRVTLPGTALLGSLQKPANERDHFLATIHRVGAGTLSLSSVAIPGLKIVTYNAARFSARRFILGNDGSPMPVINFRTQHLPILHAIARYHVLQALLIEAATLFRNPKLEPRVRHAVATIFKVLAVDHFTKSIKALHDGLGWRGVYEQNQNLQIELSFRAVGIAEGDSRVLAIRLASELLLSRYRLPAPRTPDSAIARHEAGLLAEGQESLRNIGSHRSEAYNRNILPLSVPLIQAIGYRMAVEAAAAAPIDPGLVALYEAGVILEDSAWYTEQGGISRKEQMEMEARAADALLPDLERLVAESGAEKYSYAPMASDELWDEWMDGLQEFRGEAECDVPGFGMSSKP
ncbi:putative acyl-CoA oxidase [Aspergillus mulundensis]|uniref:Putative Acyl-CoA oxidase n=1 Tax=Aspergillus mulundensis TaxID=1810919 RepID=A0A3D8RX32_9EURO|nr:putative Acyl-CoA oxidase [Aspergillus mulundensis]RDW78585.1 putative Acyl-CoA oxidase [Aspergillus mulundensis]